MEIKVREFSQEEVIVYFLGDIHEGHTNCRIDLFSKAVSIISNTNSFFVLMGDLIDCIVSAKDRRFNPVEIAQTYNITDLKDLPRKQMKNVYRAIAPIEKRCLGVIIGNHEEQYIRQHNFNIYDYLCEDLIDFQYKKQDGTNDLEIGYTGFIVLKSKDKVLRVYVNHGTGGGGFLEGYPINLVHRITKSFIADIYIMGHIHQLKVDRQNFISADSEGNLIKREAYWGISGCFLETYRNTKVNYFEHKGRWESAIGMLKLTWRPQENFYILEIVQL